MDVNAIFEHGGVTIPNPNYSNRKTNTEPKYLRVTDPYYSGNAFSDLMYDVAPSMDFDTRAFGNVDKYLKHGLTPGIIENQSELDRQLSYEQSGWDKAGNALAQTLVSEIGLGTIKGFFDLFDFTVNLFMKGDNDYTNPISNQLEQWQEQFRAATPIYTDPNVHLGSGGLRNSSWWWSNLPSIASSLTLLIPAAGVTKGVSTLGKFLKTPALTKLGKALNINESTKVSRFVNRLDNTIERSVAPLVGGKTGIEKAGLFLKTGAEGVLMRIGENYQESRQTYSDTLPNMYNALQAMTDEEYNAWVESRRDILGNDIDYNDKYEVAKRIASKAADETFKSDMANAVFDIWQLYTLRNVGRFMKAPNRMSINRLHNLSIKHPEKSLEELETMLKDRSIGRKVLDYAKDASTLGFNTVLSELSEGVEEAVNYMAQQEGITYADAILNREFEDEKYLKDSPRNKYIPFSRITTQKLNDYSKAPDLYDAAFWGILGGIAFQGMGSAFKAGQRAIEANNRKKELESLGVSPENIPSFTDRFEHPEVKQRKATIASRYIDYEAAKVKIQSIKDTKQDPFNPGNTLETEEEQRLAIRRVIEDYKINLMLKSMDSGDWKLTRQFLESDGFKQMLVDNGVLTKEEADEEQSTTKTLANKIEKMYNDNMRNVSSAIYNFARDGQDLTTIPTEFFDIISRLNIAHQIAAERINETIIEDNARLEEIRNSLPDDKKELLDGLGFDPRTLITAGVQADMLGALMAEKAELEKNSRATTLEGQGEIDLLNRRINSVKNELKKNLTTANNYLLYLHASAVASSFEKVGDKSYKPNPYNATFREIDDAIVNGNFDTLKKYGIFDDTDIENFSKLVNKDTIKSQLQLINEAYDTLYNTKKNRTLANLKDISAHLDAGYHSVALAELYRNFELGEVVTSKQEIAAKIDKLNNDMIEAKAGFLSTAMNAFQQLATKYGKDDILNLINSVVDGNGVTSVYDNFTDTEKTLFNDYLKLMQLDKKVNTNLKSRVERALQLNDIYTFTEEEDVFKNYEKQQTASTAQQTNQATAQQTNQGTQNTSTSQNQISQQQQQSVNVTSSSSQQVTTQPQNSQISPSTPQQVQISGTIRNAMNGSGFKVIITPDISPTNKSGIKIEDTNEPVNVEGVISLIIKRDNTGVVTELELDIKQAENVPDWILDNSTLFSGVGVANPTVSINPVITEQNGQIVIIRKGKIEATPSTTTTTTTTPSTSSSISSTGEQAETYIPDTLDQDVIQAIIEYTKDPSITTYNFNDVANYIRNKFPDADADYLEELISVLVPGEIQVKTASYLGKTIEAVPINALLRLSYIDDVTKNRDKAYISKTKTLLNETFEKILKNYAIHSALEYDRKNKRYVFSKESLLRYCIDVTSDETNADILYDALNKIIKNNPKYVILDEKENKSNVINNVKKDSNTRKEEGVEYNNATSINVMRYVSTLEKEERDKIFEILNKCKKGDKITYRRQSDLGQSGIDFFVNGVKVAEIPIPASSEGGSYWIANIRGWNVDVPKVNGSSYFAEQIIRILAPESSDSVGNYIRDRLIDYIKKPSKELANDIIDSIEKDDHLSPLLNNKADNTRKVNHLVSLFTYSTNSADLYMQEHLTEKSEIADRIKEQKIDSITQWINKLQESYREAERLADNPDLDIEVNSIVHGDPIYVPSKGSVSERISSTDRPNTFIGSSTTDNILLAKSSEIDNIRSRPGTPFVVIKRADGAPAIIHTDIQSLNSSNFSNNDTIKAIKADIAKEIDRLVKDWGTTHNYEDLLDFFRKLTDRYEDSTPLFKPFSPTDRTGIRVEPVDKRDISKGFQLTFFKDGSFHNIKFFSKTSTGAPTSTISYYKDGKPQGRGVVMNFSVKDGSIVSKQQALNNTIKTIFDNLVFNIDTNYINSDNNPNFILNGFATRKNGKFVISIDGTNEYTFDSFNDFILNNDIVNVGTQIDTESNSNFTNRTNITYRIIDNTSSPVKNIDETTTLSTQPTVVSVQNVGDTIKKDLLKATRKDLFGVLTNKSTTNYAKKALKELLKHRPLNILNSSEFIKRILDKNIIFVENFIGSTYVENGVTYTVLDTANAAYHTSDVEYTDKEGNKYTILAGTTVLTSRWVEFANGTLDQKERAARDIIHENVHRILTLEENKGWQQVAKNIFDAFLAADLTKDGFTEIDRKIRDAYTKNGLEEFLVESITRPELMNLLNRIPYEGEIGGKVKVKKGNLLQNIIYLICSLFKIDINENTLLDKEYKLFESIGKSVEEVKEEIKPQETINNVTTIQNTGSGFRRNRLSKIDDVSQNIPISSLESVTSNLSESTKTWFNKALNSGLISIKCN